MRTIVVATIIATLLGFALPPSPAAAANKSSHRTSAGGQIACTLTGCQRIPPGCHPEPGFDFRGNPTGYDIIVCPQR
jgi:hypothetical protein